MTIIGSAYDKLVNEFSKVYFKTLILDETYTIELNHIDKDGNRETRTEHRYNLKFQNSFLIKPIDEYPIEEYREYLDMLKNEYFRDLSSLIEELDEGTKTINLISDHLSQFKELVKEYKTFKYYNAGIQKFEEHMYHDRSFYQDKDLKEIDISWHSKISNQLIRIQFQELENVIAYLVDKKKLLKLGISSSPPVKQMQRKMEALDTLDLYQTALIFFYLNEVGVIKYKSSYEIAPKVASLTGHSAKRIKDRAFAKITDVRKGMEGRKPEIIKDNNHNVGAVKDIILEMLALVNQDIENNKEL